MGWCGEKLKQCIKHLKCQDTTTFAVSTITQHTNILGNEGFREWVDGEQDEEILDVRIQAEIGNLYYNIGMNK